MLAGSSQDISKFKGFLRKFTGCKRLRVKESKSDKIPFKRLIVRAKKQLIPVDDPKIAPAKLTEKRCSPNNSKNGSTKNGRCPLRYPNEFEYQIGTFKKAKQPGIDNFRDFEKEISNFPNAWKNKPIITFCTGGIRCEKATPLLMKQGFKDVYQLDGGILNYFEKVGGEHWKGDCFVFDERIALTPTLDQSNIIECPKCYHPITPKEQRLKTYKKGVSCPYCHNKK